MEGLDVHFGEKVLKALEGGKESEDLTGFLSGFRVGGNLYVTGCRVSADPSHGKFEQEFSQASNFLAAGVQVCGLFFKSTEADVPFIIRNVCKTIFPSTSALRNYFDSDKILILVLSDSSKQDACYWYGFEKQDVQQIQLKILDLSVISDSLITFRIQGLLTLGFEDQADSDQRRAQIQSEMQHIKDLIQGPAAIFRVVGSSNLLYNREPSDWPKLDGYANWPARRLCEGIVDAEGKEQQRCQNGLGSSMPIVDISLAFQTTGKAAAKTCITCVPVVHHDHKNFKYVTVQLPVDVLVVSSSDLQLHGLPKIFVEGLKRNLDSMADCLFNFSKDRIYRTPRPYHFQPDALDQTVTIVFPEGLDEKTLEPVRESLHRQFLLPLTRPVFRRVNSLAFSKNRTFQGRLLDVHLGLSPSGVKNGQCCTVHGHYAYYHYMQDNMDDNGWGCAYRSLQTLSSWLCLQGYTDKGVPSHKEIQQCLVSIGDKEAKFVGSRKWIGSIEVGYVINHLFGVSFKTLYVSSGSEMGTKARELANHFETNGTPVMIGGGVLAHTILGVDWNESTGDVKFLILDPHYTGGESLQIILDKGWCSWKGVDFWDKNAFYNMCLLQTPTEF